jgi:hypothetical protein
MLGVFIVYDCGCIKVKHLAYSIFLILCNVLQLGEVAEIEVLTFILAQMFIEKPNVQFSTKPAIMPNCC